MSEAQLAHIERILVMRYWLFGFIIVAIMVCALAIYSNSSAVAAMDKRMTEQSERSAKNTAMVEAAISQQVIFQATLAQIMDKMSKDNKNIKVPRVMVRPPTPIITPTPSQSPDPYKPFTDAELTRIPSAKSKPPPEKSSSTPSKRKPKAKPTATPFRWPWMRSK